MQLQVQKVALFLLSSSALIAAVPTVDRREANALAEPKVIIKNGVVHEAPVDHKRFPGAGMKVGTNKKSDNLKDKAKAAWSKAKPAIKQHGPHVANAAMGHALGIAGLAHHRREALPEAEPAALPEAKVIIKNGVVHEAPVDHKRFPGAGMKVGTNKKSDHLKDKAKAAWDKAKPAIKQNGPHVANAAMGHAIGIAGLAHHRREASPEPVALPEAKVIIKNGVVHEAPVDHKRFPGAGMKVGTNKKSDHIKDKAKAAWDKAKPAIKQNGPHVANVAMGHALGIAGLAHHRREASPEPIALPEAEPVALPEAKVVIKNGVVHEAPVDHKKFPGAGMKVGTNKKSDHIKDKTHAAWDKAKPVIKEKGPHVAGAVLGHAIGIAGLVV